ncbi:hypothetical protein BV20DRAFT_314067 [Pilatotrama ljubarskyi]|nr:hypothetical protein BV20DRAFT_314067 [Pilatotrama ljubarskyi]
MVKSREEVIEQFHQEVNMTADELEKWLEDPKSTKAGTGVGIESGHKIVEILRKNPSKDPAKYEDEDIEHMRKVVSYAKRHLAQEDHLRETKTRDELENTKSTISLKNWGHDPVKTLDNEDDRAGEEKSTATGDEEGSSKERAKAGAQEADGKPESNAEDGVAVNQSTPTNNKRKLDAEAPGEEAKEEEVEESEGAKANGDAIEGGEDGSVEDDDGLESEDRPRKKSKVGGDA